MNYFCPTHAGDYIINMRWSGEHIPESPFSLAVTEREEEGVAVGGAMNQCCSVYGDENLQEGARCDFFLGLVVFFDSVLV